MQANCPLAIRLRNEEGVGFPTPSSFFSVRGDRNPPTNLADASVVAVDYAGKVQSVSVNVSAEKSVRDLTAPNAQTGYAGISHTHIDVLTIARVLGTGGAVQSKTGWGSNDIAMSFEPQPVFFPYVSRGGPNEPGCVKAYSDICKQPDGTDEFRFLARGQILDRCVASRRTTRIVPLARTDSCSGVEQNSRWHVDCCS